MDNKYDNNQNIPNPYDMYEDKEQIQDENRGGSYVSGTESSDRNTPPLSINNNKIKHSIDGEKPQQIITKKTLITIVVICAAISLIVGLLGGILAYSISSDGKSVIYQTDSSVDTNDSSITETGTQLSDVIETASQSVVEISTETVETSTIMRQYVTEGAGSGVIISSDGYIITNNHVIDGANKITVCTKDQQTFEAKLIGTDSTTDVALLKIDATGLTPAILGDSSSLSVGDTAIAIGNPLGQLGGTVTTGIISALDREIELDGNTMDLLQTDAAINPGNSGGGLFNSNGELIGVVVAKSSGEDIEGLGFAIPINKIKTVVQDLSSYGYVTGRPAMGASLIDISTTATARQYGVNQTGVYVYSITDGGGAQKAGLQSGDLIQAIDGTAVTSSTDVKAIIQKHQVGDTINLTIVRNGQQMSVNVTLTESANQTTSSSIEKN